MSRDTTMPRDTAMPRDRFAMHLAESLGATRATECAATKLTLLRLWLRMPTTFRCTPRVPCRREHDMDRPFRRLVLLLGSATSALFVSFGALQATHRPFALWPNPGRPRAHTRKRAAVVPDEADERAVARDWAVFALQYLGGPVELREALYLLWVCAAFFTAGGQRLLSPV